MVQVLKVALIFLLASSPVLLAVAVLFVRDRLTFSSGMSREERNRITQIRSVRALNRWRVLMLCCAVFSLPLNLADFGHQQARYRSEYGLHCLRVGQVEEGIEQLQRAVELGNTDAHTLAELALAHTGGTPPRPAAAESPAPTPSIETRATAGVVKTLPKTASSLPLIGLLGLIALAAGSSLRRINTLRGTE